MTTRDHRLDWEAFEAEDIPTKSSFPHLQSFLTTIKAEWTDENRPRLMDLGCGNGQISRTIFEMGFNVVGVDVNTKAIKLAKEKEVDQPEENTFLKFSESDIATDGALGWEPGSFDVVVCQLVVSIVGEVSDRRSLLRNSMQLLVPGGWFYMSASGISDDINPGYAKLYDQDAEATGERGSYYSRDANGEVLYTTHHFTREELVLLLDGTGFEDVQIVKEKETSSRRPNEAAYFYYAVCRKPA